MPLSGLKIGFLGGGAMGEALLCGLTGSGTVPPDNLYVADLSAERLEYLSNRLKVNILRDNRDLVRQVGVVVLAVKPAVVSGVLKDIAGDLRADQTLISIAAGISTAFIESCLGKEAAVVRVMPNTPALVGLGASAVSPGSYAGIKEVELALSILGAVGRVVEVPEALMDAVTGLSGSGPAYMFVVLDALADAGVRMGLPRSVAVTLGAQTMMGAAAMVLKSGEHPARLKDQVTTPGGTTAEGLFELERGNLRATLIKAVEAATLKSKKIAGS